MRYSALSVCVLVAALLAGASSASAEPRLEALMPDLKEMPRPSWVKPGARITWWVMSNPKVPVKTEMGGTQEKVSAAAG